MVTEELFTRYNENYIARYGKEGDGDNTIRVLEVLKVNIDPTKGLYTKLVFESLFVERDELGTFSITTTWREEKYTSSGYHPASETRRIKHKTKPIEVELFLDMFLPATTSNLVNGIVRGGSYEGDGFLGFNQQPLFNASGIRIDDSNYDTSIAPTRDYHYEPEPFEPEAPTTTEPATGA